MKTNYKGGATYIKMIMKKENINRSNYILTYHIIIVNSNNKNLN